MANYWGKSPLRMQCPHCGVKDKHPVVRTDPANYHWTDEVAPLFERLVGCDISYRSRTKRCKRCEREFLSVEMARVYLAALIGEVQRLSSECENATTDLSEAKLKIQQLQDAINRAARALTRVTPKQLTGRSTRMRAKAARAG